MLEFRSFLAQLELKVQRGADEYGDASFQLPLATVISEWEAEALDIAGWGFVLWVRMQRLRDAMAKAGAE